MQNNIIHITKNDGRENPPERDLGGLIEKYFNGETSTSEEMQLRQYFRSQEVADDLKPYKSLFAYIDEEANQHKMTVSRIDSKKAFSIKQKILYFITATAACIATLLSINLFNQYSQSSVVATGNFAVIDGRYYTDVQLAKSMAFEALRNVAVPAGEYFPGENLFEQSNVMREQLRELRTLGTIFAE